MFFFQAISALCKLSNTKAGLDALFRSDLVKALKDVMAISDIIRYRVYEVCVRGSIDAWFTFEFVCNVDMMSVCVLVHTHGHVWGVCLCVAVCVSVRCLQLVVDISSVSPVSLGYCASSSFVTKLLEELTGDDILIR